MQSAKVRQASRGGAINPPHGTSELDLQINCRWALAVLGVLDGHKRRSLPLAVSDARKLPIR
jgi:hypothetical protein